MLKKGAFLNDNKFKAWYAALREPSGVRQTVVIKLIDESGKPIMAWTLENTWACEISGSALQPEGNTFNVEHLTLCYETLTIANG